MLCVILHTLGAPAWLLQSSSSLVRRVLVFEFSACSGLFAVIVEPFECIHAFCMSGRKLSCRGAVITHHYQSKSFGGRFPDEANRQFRGNIAI